MRVSDNCDPEKGTILIFVLLFSDETGNQLKQSDAKYLFVAEELLRTAKEAVTHCQEIVSFDSRFYFQLIKRTDLFMTKTSKFLLFSSREIRIQSYFVEK